MSIDFAVFHYEINAFQSAHIVQWISIDSNDISICARFYDADLSVATEQFFIDRSGTLDRLHGRQVPFDHICELATIQSVRIDADVCALGNDHTRFGGGLESFLLSLANLTFLFQGFQAEFRRLHSLRRNSPTHRYPYIRAHPDFVQL